MEEISIKVSIADVVYPLKIALEDEENVRKAAKLINEKIKAYQQDYRMSDKANLLSMVALQFATELLQCQVRAETSDTEIREAVDEIQSVLDKAF